MIMFNKIFSNKRRKTDDANGSFAEPRPPSRTSGRPPAVRHLVSADSTTNYNIAAAPQPVSKRNRGGVPPTLAEEVPVTVPETPIFMEYCSRRDRDLRPEHLRIVIVEAETNRVLFDSDTIVPVSQRIVPDARLSQCKRLQYLKHRKDVEKISQMLFGAMPGASTGNESFKIHSLHDEQRLLVSRVFTMPKSSAMGKNIIRTTESVASSDSDSYMNTIRSLDGMVTAGTISSTAPPERFTRMRNTSLHLEPPGPDENEELHFSPPHRLSRNRRRQMSHRTSLSEQSSTIAWSRSRLSSCGSHTDDEGKQVGLGLMLHSNEKQFLFQHIPLIEAELSRLEGRIITAASNRHTFIYNVSQVWLEFCDIICQLHNSPRLRLPVWLSLVEKGIDDDNGTLSADFCAHLDRLVKRLDTKNTKFFLSNVISTVLMHHMSWVASVAPPLSPAAVREKGLLIGSKLNDEAASMPYNAHMAQYLEISGSIGTTHRSAKTVVCGDDSDLITEILHVLSYFIRCSAIQHKETEDPEQFSQLSADQSFSPPTVGSFLAGSPPTDSLMMCDSTTFSPDKGSYHEDQEIEDVQSESNSVESLPSVAGPSTSRMAGHVLDRSEQADGLGRSLLAGPSTQYSPHFVLSGLVRSGQNMAESFGRMLDDVRCDDSACHRAAATSLSSSVSSSSICDVQIPDSVIILADTQNWMVKVVSGEGIGEVHSPSEAIISMLEQFCNLYEVGSPPKFLINYLEDSLADILGKSLSLVELVSGGSPSCSQQNITPDRVRSVVGCDHSDLRLILNVASVYWPPVLACVL